MLLQLDPVTGEDHAKCVIIVNEPATVQRIETRLDAERP